MWGATSWVCLADKPEKLLENSLQPQTLPIKAHSQKAQLYVSAHSRCGRSAPLCHSSRKHIFSCDSLALGVSWRTGWIPQALSVRSLPSFVLESIARNIDDMPASQLSKINSPLPSKYLIKADFLFAWLRCWAHSTCFTSHLHRWKTHEWEWI